MGRILAAVALLAAIAAPAAALELPSVETDVMCAPVTLADLLPPDEVDGLIDDGPGDSAPDRRERPREDLPSPEPEAECNTPFVYEMASPFAQDIEVFSSFGAPRPSNRLHQGIDVAVPKMTPIFAVADGVVSWVSDNCCNVAVRHGDDWTSYYIHLNNDTFGTDDGLGTGVAPGIEEGAEVRAGQLLGWVGDSGNAEETEPHLHFELRMPGGEAIDAAASLEEAEPVAMPALPIQPEPLEDGTTPPLERYPSTFSGPFADDDGHPNEWLFSLLASWGLLSACDESGLLLCPDEIPSGDDFVSMLLQAGIETPERPDVYDRGEVKDPPSSLEDGVAVRGCGTRRYCPDQPVSDVEATGLLVRSTLPEWEPPLTETTECNALDSDGVSRAGLLLRIAEALGIVAEPPCHLID